MVSNGYITREAFHDIYDISMRRTSTEGVTENFYGKITPLISSRSLRRCSAENETSVWFEITNLMLPTLNDDPAETHNLPNGF